MRVLAVVVVCAGCGASSPHREAPAGPAAETEADPCASAGTWRSVSALDLPGRVDHTAVWTGREMVLWGGTQGTDDPWRDGARYRPGDDRWAMTTTDGAPLERDDHAAVWTGREMIVWGGNHYDEDRGNGTPLQNNDTEAGSFATGGRLVLRIPAFLALAGAGTLLGLVIARHERRPVMDLAGRLVLLETSGLGPPIAPKSSPATPLPGWLRSTLSTMTFSGQGAAMSVAATRSTRPAPTASRPA